MIRCNKCGQPIDPNDGDTIYCVCGAIIKSDTEYATLKIVRCEKCGTKRRSSSDDSECSICYPQTVPLTITGPCIHIGEQTRLVECSTCNGKTKLKVFRCSVKGECTLSPNADGLVSCPCEHYSKVEMNKMRFVTNVELVQDTMRLLRKVPHELSGIAGIPRSGMIPASLLATNLHLPLYTLTHTGLNLVGCGWRLSDTIHHERKGPILVVDDTSMYGGAMKMARDFWKKFSNGRDAIFSTVYCSPAKYHRHGPMPDIYAAELEDPHLLEWCLFNCGYARSMAFDFDGILTHDGTEHLLYKPQKFPIELIITGRIEAERKRSEKWLERHKIQVKKMIMWPGDLESRNKATKQEIGAYKARHFIKSGLRFFVESHPDEAAEIARLSKKPVICPSIGKVF